MHRSVAGVTGAILLGLGAFSFHPVAMFVLVSSGLLFLAVAIVGRPKPDLSIPKEIGAVLVLAAIAITLVSIGAYLDR